MSQENQGKSSAVPVSILPVKRRRGRPRKDENPLYMRKATVSPVPDLVKTNQHQTSDSTAHTDSGLVGQIVSGVLDGSFEAGYMLTVKVGNTNTFLRGVVFEPGRSVPISAANDVAPDVKMFKRSEIPLPVIQPLNQVPVSAPSSEAKNKQPVNPVPKTMTAIPMVGPLSNNNCPPIEPSKDADHEPQVAAQVNQCSSKTESSAIAKGQTAMLSIAFQASPSDIVKGTSNEVLPDKTKQFPPNSAQITIKSSNDNQAVPVVTSALTLANKAESLVVALQEREAPFQPSLSNGTTATNDLMLEPKAEQSIKISSVGECVKEGRVAINLSSQVQTNTSGSPLNLDPSVDAQKDVPAEINHPPLATSPGSSRENNASVLGSSVNAAVQANLVSSGSNVPNEISKRYEATHLIEGSTSDAIDTSKDDLLNQHAINALCNVQSGYAADQLRPTQQTTELQSCDLIAPTTEGSLVTKDAILVRAPMKPMEPMETTAFMEPNKAIDSMQVNEGQAARESPSRF